MTDDLDPTISAQAPLALERTDLFLPGTTKYEGKVRDVYRAEDRLVIVTTDRVSAFDVVLGTIPFKGEILNRMALWGFEQTSDVLPNHVLSSPDPNVTIAKPCAPFPVEFVMRGYITGSLWRDVLSGAHAAYEVDLPAGLQKDQQLPTPILTPSTKAEIGTHDEPTSRRAVIASGAMTQAQWEAAESAARRLFARGQQLATARGLILVDTKYEMGLDAHGALTLIDEVHTPDSSRYWVAASYADRFAQGVPQQMLDKENLREWLRARHGYSGDGPPPPLDDEIRGILCRRYFDAFRRITGAPFVPTVGSVADRIAANLARAL